MGCCSAIPASAPASEASASSVRSSASSAARSASGQPIEVIIDGSAKVLIASASYCYCLLISSAAIFVDVRDKESFSKSHLYGAWSLHSHVTRDEVASNALKSLCDLQRVVVVSEANPLKDDKVKRLLELLKKTARPSRVFLMDNLPQFQQRFPFCMRQGSETFPLPPCPSELWVPEPEKRQQPPALYLGPVTCLERRHEALQCFKIGAVVQLVDDLPNQTPLGLPGSIKLQRVQVAKMELETFEGTELEAQQRTLDLAAKVAASSLEASERILSLRVPCFLCGPWSAVVAALALRRILVSELRTTEELCGFLKDRCATTALPHVAILALNLALGSPSPECLALAVPAQAAQLRQRLGEEAATVPLKTVRSVLEKVLAQPSEERFRRLKASNPRVQREVLAHPEEVLLLHLAGFTTISRDLVLPGTAAMGPLRQVLQSV